MLVDLVHLSFGPFHDFHEVIVESFSSVCEHMCAHCCHMLSLAACLCFLFTVRTVYELNHVCVWSSTRVNSACFCALNVHTCKVCVCISASSCCVSLCRCAHVCLRTFSHFLIYVSVCVCVCVHIRPLCLCVLVLFLICVCVCVWIMCPVGGCFLCVCSVSLDKVGDISALEQRDTTQQHLANFPPLSLSRSLSTSLSRSLPRLLYLISLETPSASQEHFLTET